MFATLLFFSSARVLVIKEERSFVQWMRNTNQIYTGDEYHFRLGLFIAKLRFINEFNKRKNESYKLGLNKLSCLTPDEYKIMCGYRQLSNCPTSYQVKLNSNSISKTHSLFDDLPESLDWRDQGIVNGIKDQGQCGSCWAFATTQCMESINALRFKSLFSFSEQNLVDCDPQSNGCAGGSPFSAFMFISRTQNGQINLEDDYPYTGTDTNDCKFDPSKGYGRITGFMSVQAQSEEDLFKCVASVGPIAVCIDASLASFNSYSSGIYNDRQCSSTVLDHAVGCIGYGAEGGVKYWIVRNSWGSWWGENGYVRMARDAGNLCGIASQALYCTIL